MICYYAGMIDRLVAVNHLVGSSNLSPGALINKGSQRCEPFFYLFEAIIKIITRVRG